MYDFYKIMEIISLSTWVTGFALNLLLLFLIRRFSSKELGTYKYLLEIFAAYDACLVFIHHFLNPTAVPSAEALAIVCDASFGNLELMSFHSSSYAVPFLLLTLHLLYRYWTVSRPERIALFSNKLFVGAAFVITLSSQASWFAVCRVLGAPENIEEVRKYQAIFEREYNRTIHDGWLILDYWRHGEPSWRAIAMLIFIDVLEVGSFSCAATLAILTFLQIRRAHTQSVKYRDYQMSILIAVSVQTLTPTLFVHIPYLLNVNLPLFHLSFPVFSSASMVLVSFFPCIDALVIIVLMKPYRDGLLGLLRLKRVNPLPKNSTNFTTMVTTHQDVSDITPQLTN